MNIIEIKLESLSKSKFRSSFHLSSKDIKYINNKGLDIIRIHAKNFIKKRLAPACIPNDGKQTQMKNHPVFIAEHATATCCRSCLYKWHNIPKNKALTNEEQKYIVDLIMLWITKELSTKEEVYEKENIN